MIPDPPAANSTTIHSRLVYQDKNLCFGSTAYVSGPEDRNTVALMMHLKNIFEFRMYTPGYHNLFYDSLRYHPPPRVTCHISHVTYHVSRVMCHVPLKVVLKSFFHFN